jgi:Tol biopolymer transport system component
MEIRRNASPLDPARLAFVLPLLAALSMPAGAAEFRKLTEGPPFSDVLGPILSADGRWVVYWHDREFDDVFELYSVAVDGSAPPERISGLLPVDGLGIALISPDSSTVVYSAEQDTTGVRELYSVPIDGGTPTKISGPMIPGGEVSIDLFDISPTGARVVYLADQESHEVHELFSVPITGGTPVRLNGPLVPGGDVLDFTRFEINSTGTRVVYLADQESDQVHELFSVPITGGTGVKLNGPLPAGGIVFDFFQINPAGNRVVYVASELHEGDFELFSVPITGGANVKLNGALASAGDVVEARIDPTGNRVVYLADQQSDGLFELYTAPITGGTVVKLNGPLVPGGDVSGSPGFAISSTGNRVVYRADQQIDGVHEIYGVPITGGAPVKLNGPLVTEGDVLDFQLSPDGAWVVYRADQEFNDLTSLYRAPVAGPTGNDELLGFVFPPSRGHWRIDPQGNRVVAAASAFFDSVVRPWSLPLVEPIGFAQELVDESLFTAGGDVLELLVGPEGSIVYVADQDTDEVDELYSLPHGLLFADGFGSGDLARWSSSSV